MAIYVARGLEPSLAKEIAEQLMAHDALGAHARDGLGISETHLLPILLPERSWLIWSIKRSTRRRGSLPK